MKKLLILLFLISLSVFAQEEYCPHPIETSPYFTDCKGDNTQKGKCLNTKIKEHYSQNFNTEIFKNLNLEKGKHRIIILFKINEKGMVSEVQTHKYYKTVQLEAERVFMSLPKMIPAKQNDVPVPVKYVYPIIFYIE